MIFLARTIEAEKLFVVLAQATEVLGALIFFKLVSLHLSESELGAYFLATSLMALILLTSFSVFEQGVMRNVVKYRKQNRLPQIYSACFFSYLTLACVLAVALSFASRTVDNHWTVIVAYTGVWILSEPLKNLVYTISNADRKRKRVAMFRLVEVLFRNIALVIFINLIEPSVQLVLSVMALSSLIVVVLSIAGSALPLKNFDIDDLKLLFRDAVGFSWPLLIWSIFGWLQNMSSKWLLERFADAEDVARLGVIMALAAFPFTALLGILSAYSLPVLYQKETSSPGTAAKDVKRIVVYFLPVALLVVSGNFVFGADVISIASSEIYSEYSGYLTVLAAGAALQAVGTILTYKDFATMKTARLIWPNVIPGLTSVILGIVWVPEYGLEGALVSILAGNLIFLLLQYINFRRC